MSPLIITLITLVVQINKHYHCDNMIVFVGVIMAFSRTSPIRAIGFSDTLATQSPTEPRRSSRWCQYFSLMPPEAS